MDGNGQKHFTRLKRGLNTSFQLGYFFNEKNAVALVYSKLASKEKTEISGNEWDSFNATTYGGITYQRFIPVGVKKDVNFNIKLGPGFLFYRDQTAITNGVTGIETPKDYSKRIPGFLSGIGFDFRINDNVRFELNADKTWGKINDANNKINLGVIAVGAGIRFQF